MIPVPDKHQVDNPAEDLREFVKDFLAHAPSGSPLGAKMMETTQFPGWPVDLVIAGRHSLFRSKADAYQWLSMFALYVSMELSSPARQAEKVAEAAGGGEGNE